jgi:hypothetical protein
MTYERLDEMIANPDSLASGNSRSTLEYAEQYLAAGLSVLPIKADGSKAPDWRKLPLTIPTPRAS